MIFVAYELNLPLNMEKPHYRSQRAGEWSLIWAHDSQSPDISRSHLYRGTIAWTPPTAIYRAYTVPVFEIALDWESRSDNSADNFSDISNIFQRLGWQVISMGW